jgi:hypothetical protein
MRDGVLCFGSDVGANISYMDISNKPEMRILQFPLGGKNPVASLSKI